MLFRRSFSALLFQRSLSATSCHPQFSINSRQFLLFQRIEIIHFNSLFSSPFSTLYSLKVLSISYGFASIPCFDECTFELESCVNLGEQPTSLLAPRSVKLLSGLEVFFDPCGALSRIATVATSRHTCIAVLWY
uniref:Uncharacterized protein n=1 Tax=Cucumis melo TaxID=3656 RepID=A0A9I9E7B4_CUCME